MTPTAEIPDPDLLRVLRVDHYGVEAEPSVSRVPLRPGWMVVQALEFLPRNAAVVGIEQTCGLDPGVDPAPSVGLDVPCPLDRELILLPLLLLLCSVSRCGLGPLPGLPAVRLLQMTGPHVKCRPLRRMPPFHRWRRRPYRRSRTVETAPRSLQFLREASLHDEAPLTVPTRSCIALWASLQPPTRVVARLHRPLRAEQKSVAVLQVLPVNEDVYVDRILPASSQMLS